MLNVVLYQPEIPPNTGNIGRLCHATGTRLHLIEPLGFSLDEKSLKRAGLDYWEHVDLHLWDSLESLRDQALADEPSVNFYYITKKADKVYWDQQFRAGDYLVFGKETKGLPEK